MTNSTSNRHLLTFILVLLFTCLSVSQALASPKLQSNKKYHIVCRQFPQGCVADGASVGQQTPLYYLQSATNAEETYWEFEEVWAGSGFFAIKNAKTGQYIVWDGERDTYHRYISMMDDWADFCGVWIVRLQSDGVYIIRNAMQEDHIWDVRVDSYMVGTYSNGGMGNTNQLFSFYDEEGNIVKERYAIETPQGFFVSSWLVANTESADNWKFTGGGWSDPGRGWYENDGSYVYSPFLERWHDRSYGGLSDGSMSQTLKNVPAGTYTLAADMIAVFQNQNPSEMGSPARGVYLFAGRNQTAASTGSERPQYYTVSTTLSEMGDLTLGVLLDHTTANWVAVDNFDLFFNGTEEELIEAEKAKVRADLADYYSPEEIDALIARTGKTLDDMEELRLSAGATGSANPFGRVLAQLTIDGHTPVYVPSLDLYLCTLPLEKFGTTASCPVNYELREGSSNLSIEGTEVAPGKEYQFQDIAAQRNYKLSAKTADGAVVAKELTFTSLPVVRISGDFNNYYSEGSIAVHEPDQQAAETLRMKAKWRGGITNGSSKHKRNYHVKLLDENGEKLERKFFGLRNDNSWILEACQVDMSRIRNRMLTDLWNDYSVKPYYSDKETKVRTGTRGRFVELILNDEYRGIYCMTENMDRKQMKLKQYDEETGTVHGQLWKSKDWSYATLMGTRPDGGYTPKDYLNDPDGNDEMWDQYQVKYPAIEDVTPTDWSTLYRAVDFVCHSGDAEFGHYIVGYFDLPLVIDYYILMETTLATDNHGKNMFFACYDRKQSQKITFGVWDMDASLGQRWSDDYYHNTRLMNPEGDYAEYIQRNEHGDYNLFRRLRNTNADNFNQRVRLRYRDLRETFLKTDAILDRFRKQLGEFKTCGADQREYERWSGDTDVARRRLDFDNEMDYIEDWVTKRMNYLDTQRFDIASLPPSGIDNVLSSSSARRGIYTLGGRLVTTDCSEQQLNSLPKGMYIIYTPDGSTHGRKLIVGE